MSKPDVFLNSLAESHVFFEMFKFYNISPEEMKKRFYIENPQIFYDLEKNKGYGTKKHLDGIRKHGISEWHRKTFGICKKFT